ncbi:uncharacterized protein [Asterias amurensis]|uniref:uncharacterized protein n=1 Tax=Asterias amurensis TaxID=7602 RepID=UPI003AB78F94
MFRFASEYASVKFRSLSGHRLAGSKLGPLPLPQEPSRFLPAVISQSASASQTETEVREDQCLPPQAAPSYRVEPKSGTLVVESGQQLPELTRSLFDKLRTRLMGNHKVVPLPALTETGSSDSLARVVQHKPVKWNLVPNQKSLSKSPRTSSLHSSQEQKVSGQPEREGLERGEQNGRKRPKKRRCRVSSSAKPVSIRGSVAPPQNDKKIKYEREELQDEDQDTRMDQKIQDMSTPEVNSLGVVDVMSPKRQRVYSLSPSLNQTSLCSVSPTLNQLSPSFGSTQALHNQTPPVLTSAYTAPQCVDMLPRIDTRDLDLVFRQKGSSYSPVTLGQGANGQVILMQRRSDNSLVAIKHLTHTGNQYAANEEFTRETQAMSAVSSSTAFPKLLGVVNRNSFAMEFIGTLDQKTSWSVLEAFSPPRLLKSQDWLKVCIDITKGLMDMHAAGWTHNDLHNANVMVLRDTPDQSGTWEGKIIDLGCASRINDPPPVRYLSAEDQKHCFKYCGQLAPEIIEGRSTFSPLSDVFSLGVLFRDIARTSRHLSHLKSLGKRCSHPLPKMRPAMGQVLQELTSVLKSHKNNPPKSRIGSLYQAVKHHIRS